MKQIFILLIISSLSFSAQAQELPYKLEHYNLKKNLAIQGYDPVAYFTESEAVEGNKSISYKRDGIIYYFTSNKNKDLFKSNPTKYEPQYGGYCAYAMAFGDKVKIDPETFKIIDDKLYLFYNFRFNNTLKSWNKDEANLHSKADASWQKIINK